MIELLSTGITLTVRMSDRTAFNFNYAGALRVFQGPSRGGGTRGFRWFHGFQETSKRPGIPGAFQGVPRDYQGCSVAFHGNSWTFQGDPADSRLFQGHLGVAEVFPGVSEAFYGDSEDFRWSWGRSRRVPSFSIGLQGRFKDVGGTFQLDFRWSSGVAGVFQVFPIGFRGVSRAFQRLSLL